MYIYNFSNSKKNGKNAIHGQRLYDYECVIIQRYYINKKKVTYKIRIIFESQYLFSEKAITYNIRKDFISISENNLLFL